MTTIAERPAHQATTTAQQQADALRQEWATNSRWAGVRRDWTPEDVITLRGSVQEEPTLARLGAERL